jgi:hypothetical protein
MRELLTCAACGDEFINCVCCKADEPNFCSTTCLLDYLDEHGCTNRGCQPERHPGEPCPVFV